MTVNSVWYTYTESQWKRKLEGAAAYCLNVFLFPQDDTKGDYEKILLALCGGEN